MAKLKLEVAHNVSLNRDGKIHKAGDTFEAERDYEINRWIALGYVVEQKSARRRARK